MNLQHVSSSLHSIVASFIWHSRAYLANAAHSHPTTSDAEVPHSHTSCSHCLMNWVGSTSVLHLWKGSATIRFRINFAICAAHLRYYFRKDTKVIESFRTISQFGAEIPGVCHVVGALSACAQWVCNRIGRTSCVRLPRRHELHRVVGYVTFRCCHIVFCVSVKVPT